jgi:8-oxo-dGTP diphosphatase
MFPTHIVAVGGLVTNHEGKVLLVKSPRRGWEFPGGVVEVGEDLLSALKREVEEESGIIIEVKELVGVYSNTQMYVKEETGDFVPTKVIFGFLGKMVSGELRTSEESVEVGWFERESVLDMITHHALKDRTRDMLEFDGKVMYRVYSTSPYEIHLQEVLI